MWNYVARRLIAAALTLFVLTIGVFALVRFIPGSLLDVTLEGNFNFADRQALQRELGLDKPAPVQYVEWLGGVLHGDFGRSLTSQRRVMDDIKLRLPHTLELGVLAIVFTFILAVPIGIISAVKQNTWIDYSLRGVAIGLVSIPYFWVATVAVIFPARWWGWSPPSPIRSFTADPVTNLIQFGFPAAVLGLFTAGGLIMRVTRAQMLEVMRSDYVRTARAKGLAGFSIVTRHAMRNALIPVVTLLGITVSFLLGGSVIVETIFNLPGLGIYILSSVNNRDYVAIQGVVLLFGIVVMLVNLLTDLAYGLIDPRIKYQ